MSPAGECQGLQHPLRACSVAHQGASPWYLGRVIPVIPWWREQAWCRHIKGWKSYRHEDFAWILVENAKKKHTNRSRNQHPSIQTGQGGRDSLNLCTVAEYGAVPLVKAFTTVVNPFLLLFHTCHCWLSPCCSPAIYPGWLKNDRFVDKTAIPTYILHLFSMFHVTLPQDPKGRQQPTGLSLKTPTSRPCETSASFFSVRNAVSKWVA